MTVEADERVEDSDVVEPEKTVEPDIWLLRGSMGADTPPVGKPDVIVFCKLAEEDVEEEDVEEGKMTALV